MMKGEHMNECPNFDSCPANWCPLDEFAYSKLNFVDEARCPYTVNKRRPEEKGIKTKMPEHLLKFIVNRNAKSLSRRNFRRWRKV